MTTLADFGWTQAHQQTWDAEHRFGAIPARVIADFGTSLKVATPDVLTAELSGKLAHYSDRDDTPKVGDWVSITISENNNVTVEAVILRANEIARKVTGKRTLKQIIATNVDIAFVLLALDNNFNVERLKRFLYQLAVSSIKPVIVLNKADKTDDLDSFLIQLEQLNLPIIITTATEGAGVDAIAERITAAKTAILLGSSGVGKSTMTNALLGRTAQMTGEVRDSDAQGKHTTVHRELFILPNKGILIDTPGIRELQLWGSEEELDASYDDVIAIASQCKYTNCRHTTEQGCAINAALADGTLDRKHYENYVKMKRELVDLASKSAEKIKGSKQRITRSNKKKRDNEYGGDLDRY